MIVYAKNNRRKRLTTIFTIFVLCLVCLIVNNNIKLVVGDDEHEEEHLDTEDEEDMKEVEAIVNQTDIIKMIVQQKQGLCECKEK